MRLRIPCLALALLGACTPSPDQPSKSTRQNVRCSLGGECTSDESRVTAKPASPEISREAKALGPGLPLAITEKGYRELLAQTRIVRTGAHAAAAGPVALGAALSSMGLEVNVQVAPIPNLEAYAEKLGTGVWLRVTSVKDTQGKELLDATSQEVTDPARLRLEREPPMFAVELVGNQKTVIDAVRVPGSNAVELYAKHSVPLVDGGKSSRLGRVEGRIELSLPVGAAALEQREPKWSLSRGPVALEGKREGWRVELVVTKGNEYVITHVARNAAGEVLETLGDSQGLDGAGKAKRSCTYDGEVASVSVVLAESVLQLTYPFVLTP